MASEKDLRCWRGLSKSLGHRRTSPPASRNCKYYQKPDQSKLEVLTCFPPFFYGTIPNPTSFEAPAKFLFSALWLHSSVQFNSVQSLSPVRLCATPWITARQASLSITISQSSLRLTSIESVMPSSHLVLCHPFSSCPQSLPASESFPMSQLFTWGGQSTGVSALALFLPKH